MGERLDPNIDTLEQFSLDVRTAATSDQLPGVMVSFLQSYNAARTAVFGPENPAPPTGDDAPEPGDEAVGLTALLQKEVRSVTHAGMHILFFADGAWPHWQENSTGPRHAFGLPADRPYAPTQPENPVADPSGGIDGPLPPPIPESSSSSSDETSSVASEESSGGASSESSSESSSEGSSESSRESSSGAGEAGSESSSESSVESSSDASSESSSESSPKSSADSSAESSAESSIESNADSSSESSADSSSESSTEVSSESSSD